MFFNRFIFYKILLVLALGLSLSSCSYDKTELTLGSAFDSTWQFNSGNNYDFDDELIEFSGGQVQLRALDFTTSGTDFNLGEHNGTVFTNNDHVTLQFAGTAQDIATIRPELASSLLGYWKFDGNYNDSSTSALTGTPLGQIHLAPGRVNQAANFDGDNDRFTVPDSDLFDGRAQLTIMGWVKPLRNMTDYDAIISKRITSNDNQAFTIWHESNKLKVDIVGFGNRFETNALVEAGVWTHFALVYDGSLSMSERAKVYINGVLDVTASEDSASIPNFNSDLSFGTGQAVGSQSFMGELDEVAFLAEAATPQQVNAIWSAQKNTFADQTELSPDWTPQWSNIVGYWKMDGNWQDSSGNNNHGSPANATSSTAEAKIGSNALLLNGTDEYLDLGSIDSSNPLSLNGSSFTISAWVYRDPAGNADRVLDKSSSSFAADGYSLAVRDNGELVSYMMGSTFNSGFFIPFNTWSYITYVQSATLREFYYNGQLVNSQTGSYTLPGATTTNARIGNWQTDNNRTFGGRIDDLVVWNTTLSPVNIATIFNRQKQNFASHFDSSVINLGSTTAPWPDLSWATSLPFGKELVGDVNNDGSPDEESSASYAGVTSQLNEGLIRYWPFNETTTDSVNPGTFDFQDFSGQGQNLNISGGVTPNQSGRFNKAVKFDGSTGYIEDNSVPPLVAGQAFTISLWVQPENFTNPAQYIASFNTSTGGNRLLIGISTSKRFHVHTSMGAPITAPIFNDFNGGWYHLVLTYSADDVEFFVDGISAGTHTLTSPLSATNLFSFGQEWDGGLTASNFYSGRLDEAALWDRVLTNDEIIQLYRRGANSVNLQVKSCIDSDCNCKSYNVAPAGSASDCDGDGTLNNDDDDDSYKAEFIGPGGDGTTYYNELFNRSSSDLTFNCALNTSDSDAGICVSDEIETSGMTLPGRPEFLNTNYSQFVTPAANQFAQYRVYMQADNNTACSGTPCLPNVTNINLNPSNTTKYTRDYVEVKPKTAINFTTIINANIDADACATFRLYRNPNYFYHDGTSWVPASSESDRNIASDVTNNIKQFETQFGSGELEVIGYLRSDLSQTSQCSIDEIDVNYE